MYFWTWNRKNKHFFMILAQFDKILPNFTCCYAILGRFLCAQFLVGNAKKLFFRSLGSWAVKKSPKTQFEIEFRTCGQSVVNFRFFNCWVNNYLMGSDFLFYAPFMKLTKKREFFFKVDTWHVTYDMWHVTCTHDTYLKTNICLKSHKGKNIIWRVSWSIKRQDI